MWSIIAASVVDLPEPVVPVSRMIPRSSSASWEMTGGRLSSSTVRIECGIARRRAQRAALAKGVDAEARDARDRVREVDLVLAGELLELHRIVQHRVRRGLGVLGGQRSGPSIGRRSPSTRVNGGAGILRWRSEPPSCTRLQRALSTSNTPPHRRRPQNPERAAADANSASAAFRRSRPPRRSSAQSQSGAQTDRPRACRARARRSARAPRRSARSRRHRGSRPGGHATRPSGPTATCGWSSSQRSTTCDGVLLCASRDLER